MAEDFLSFFFFLSLFFFLILISKYLLMLLPDGSEEREVLGVGSGSVAILPSGQDMKTTTF